MRDHKLSNLSFTLRIFSLSFIRIYFSAKVLLDMLLEFCFNINYKLFTISFIPPFLSFAVVISPIALLIEPSRIKVAPYLLYRSKETPPIRHN